MILRNRSLCSLKIYEAGTTFELTRLTLAHTQQDCGMVGASRVPLFEVRGNWLTLFFTGMIDSDYTGQYGALRRQCAPRECYGLSLSISRGTKRGLNGHL